MVYSVLQQQIINHVSNAKNKYILFRVLDILTICLDKLDKNLLVHYVYKLWPVAPEGILVSLLPYVSTRIRLGPLEQGWICQDGEWSEL